MSEHDQAQNGEAMPHQGGRDQDRQEGEAELGAEGNKLKGSSKRKQDQRSTEGIEVNKSVGRSQSKIKGQERQGQYQREQCQDRLKTREGQVLQQEAMSRLAQKEKNQGGQGVAGTTREVLGVSIPPHMLDEGRVQEEGDDKEDHVPGVGQG